MKIHKHIHVCSAATLAIVLVGAAFGIGILAMMFFAVRPASNAPLVAALSFSPDALLAKSAIVYDPTSGRVLFSKNADEPLPLASLTKLMTAQMVLDTVSPKTLVTITEADLAPGGDWDGGLKLGDTPSVATLLQIGLIASSNDAITAAARSTGPQYLFKMNTLAKSMGLSTMKFLNPTGLDIDTNTSGAYGSAYDVARLAAYFYANHPNYFELTQQPSVSVQSGGQELLGVATAAPLLATPGFIAAKTGYTDLAGGNLVALFDVEVGHPEVAVVLGSTENDRFSDMLALIKAARAAESKQ